MKCLVKIDKCKTNHCTNYALSMQDKCHCNACKDCVICELKNVCAYDLLDNVCWQSHSLFPFMSCANGNCSDKCCHVGKFRELLRHCDGCHDLNRIPLNDITYKCI